MGRQNCERLCRLRYCEFIRLRRLTVAVSRLLATIARSLWLLLKRLR